MDASPSTRRAAAIAVAALAGALAVAGCGGDGEEPSIPQSGVRVTTTEKATTTTEPLAVDTTEVGAERTDTTAVEAGEEAPGDEATSQTTAAGEG